MKRITVFLLLLCLIPGLLCAFMTGSGVGGMADAATAKSHSGLLSIPDPTTDEIRAENAKYKTPTQRFSSNPLVVAPYGTGTLHQSLVAQQLAVVDINKVGDTSIRDDERRDKVIIVLRIGDVLLHHLDGGEFKGETSGEVMVGK